MQNTPISIEEAQKILAPFNLRTLKELIKKGVISASSDGRIYRESVVAYRDRRDEVRSRIFTSDNRLSFEELTLALSVSDTTLNRQREKGLITIILANTNEVQATEGRRLLRGDSLSPNQIAQNRRIWAEIQKQRQALRRLLRETETAQ
jgi:hypothetical protein